MLQFLLLQNLELLYMKESGYNNKDEVIWNKKTNEIGTFINENGKETKNVRVASTKNGKIGIVLYNSCIDADGDYCDVLIEVNDTKSFKNENEGEKERGFTSVDITIAMLVII